MSITPPAPALLIPESAPFNADQRAWLSGFFAGLIAPGATGSTALSAGEAANLAAGAPERASNDAAPWHDPAMPLDERLKLAEGKPPAPRLMAAMAQQDCGQCGYNCADYANALFTKAENRLNLCAPGGKDTLRALKALTAEIESAAPVVANAAPAVLASPDAGERGRSREAPAEAVFLSRTKLNGAGSAKDTWHIEFDLTPSGLDYQAGDAFAIFPKNDTGLVDQIIAMLGVSHGTPVRGTTLRRVLSEEVSLSPAPDALFELLSYVSGGAARAKARALARGEDPDGDADRLDVLAALMKFAGIKPHPEAFVEALEPLQPRLYSISSSIKANPGRVSLTVDAVRYMIGKRKRVGVASTYLAERVSPGDHVQVYVQRAHAFGLPENPNVPIIMIGPGTGVAPFRAFLQERMASAAEGRAWLFYGHQHEKTDFFYRDELTALKKSGILTRLSLAWSRDGSEKIYVQDRMRELGSELWRWLADGAHFYVCGDAKRMAKDVEAALIDIIAQHGARSVDEAIQFVAALKKAGRYQSDVY